VSNIHSEPAGLNTPRATASINKKAMEIYLRYAAEDNSRIDITNLKVSIEQVAVGQNILRLGSNLDGPHSNFQAVKANKHLRKKWPNVAVDDGFSFNSMRNLAIAINGLAKQLPPADRDAALGEMEALSTSQSRGVHR